MWKNLKKHKLIASLTMIISLLALVAGVVYAIQVNESTIEANESTTPADLSNEAYSIQAMTTIPTAQDARDPGLISAVKFVDTGTYYYGGMALDDQGAVWSWGYNIHGQLGQSLAATTASSGAYSGGMARLKYFVDNNIKIVKVKSGYHTNYAIDENGVLYAWGLGSSGQMGNGTNTSTNITPVIVDKFPTGTKVKDIFVTVEAATSLIALTEDGKVYEWGYGGEPNMLGTTTNIPRDITQNLSDAGIGEIKDIAVGWRHNLVLDADGNVWSWGNGTTGQLGHGNITSSSTIKKIDWFVTNGKKVKAISANYDNSLAITEDNEMYQWGRTYVSSTTATNRNIPTLVEYDTSSASYQPIPTHITAGRYVHYMTDQYGRVWTWGLNSTYSFAEDGPLFNGGSVSGKLNTVIGKATLQPTVLGDGDTEEYGDSIKAPVFSNWRGTMSRLTELVNFYQQWGNFSDISGGNHPTIYDKKYMRTTAEPITPSTVNATTQAAAHAKIYPLDNKDRRLVYVIRVDGGTSAANYTYSGNFYVADASYTGNWVVYQSNSSTLPAGVTEVTSVPEIKDSEKSWISAVVDLDTHDWTGTNLQELPYVTHISTYQSAVLFLDRSGNLYKQALDGSGSVAWGWDKSTYDELAGHNYGSGLYNSYAYEVMYMRGSPGINASSVEIKAPAEKIYSSQNKTQKVDVSITLGEATTSEQLNITIEPELTAAKYIVMPYDPSDGNITKGSPSEEDFLTAYNSGNYVTGDYIADHPEWDTKQLVGEPQTVLSDDNVTISENSVVWVYTVTSGYSANVGLVKAITYDNFYTELALDHTGVDHSDTSKEVYSSNTENITKATNDGIADLIGFPLDVNGNIIGTPASPPTFNYDQVTVSKLSDAQLEAINTNLTKFWVWFTPQAESKTYTLNGVDASNNDDITAATGELAVTAAYTHTFHYDVNPDALVNLHYIGVDTSGNRIDEFSMTPNPENDLFKETEYTRTPPTLSADSGYIIKGYKVVYTTPPASPVTVTGLTDVNAAGEMVFEIPWDTSVTDATVIVVYEQAPMAYFISADRGVTPYTGVAGFVDESARTSKGETFVHEPSDAAIDSEYALVGYKIFNGKVTDVSTLDLTASVQPVNADGKAEFTPPTGQEEYTVVYIYEKAPLVHYVAADKGLASNNLLADFSMSEERLAKDETHSKTPVYANDDYVAVGYKVIAGKLTDGATTTDLSGYTTSTNGTASFKPSDYGYELTVIFVYEKKTLVHFVGVNAEDPANLTFMSGWDIASRKEVKGTSNTQTPKDYTTPDGYKPIGYYVVNGQVTDPTTVDLTQAIALINGDAAYTVPTDIDEITIIFVYEIPPSVGTLHVRQVIVDPVKAVELPSNGFMSLHEGNPGTPWTYTGNVRNIVTPSDKATTTVPYSDYELPITKETMGYGLKWVTPQYYTYQGYKISSTDGNYDASGMVTDKTITIDFTDHTEYWVTVYLKPTTTTPGNYGWATVINNFGSITFN